MHASKVLEVDRNLKGKYNFQQIKNIYDEYGVVVLKEFIDPKHKLDIRSIMVNACNLMQKNNLMESENEFAAALNFHIFIDVLSIRTLAKYNYIFATKELSNILKFLLDTDTVVYYGESNIHYGSGTNGLHKDNAERINSTHNDWDGSYGLLRCAFYCQDHFNSSGGLKVRLKSHIKENTLDSNDKNKISCEKGKLIDIRSFFGDLVIWSMRTTHAGNSKLFKFSKNISCHPKFYRKKIEKYFFEPEEEERIALFFAIAKKGAHFDNYKNWWPYVESQKKCRNQFETKQIMESSGYFLESSDIYGLNDHSNIW